VLHLSSSKTPNIFLNVLDVVSHQIPEVVYHAAPSRDFFVALLASDFQKGKERGIINDGGG
jgi:hypothetical protein